MTAAEAIAEFRKLFADVAGIELPDNALTITADGSIELRAGGRWYATVPADYFVRLVLFLTKARRWREEGKR